MAVIHSTRPTRAPLSRPLTGAELQLKQRAKLYAGLDPALDLAPACADYGSPDTAGVEVCDGR